MDYTPLVVSANAAVNRCTPVRRLLDELRMWWRVTRSPGYMGHSVSRRDMRVILIPAIWAVFASIDARMDQVIDVVVCLTAMFLSFIPTNTLYSDVAFTSLNYAFILMIMLFDPKSEFNQPSVALASMNAICGLVGVHTSVTFAYMLAFAPLDLLWHPSANSAWAYLGCLIELGVCAAFEHRNGKIYDEIDVERRALHHVVEGASNGSCTISVDSGTIIQSNSKFQETFGRPNLEGVRFTDLCANADARKVELVYDLVKIHELVDPFLISCRTEYCEFDAKAIPYSASASQLRMCVQVQGEKRFRHDGDPTNGVRVQAVGTGQSLSHPSAFPVSRGADTWLGYSDTAPSGAMSVRTHDVETAIQTDAQPSRSRPPALPSWMEVRGEAHSDSGSEVRSIGSNDGVRRVRSGKLQVYTLSGNPVLPQFRMMSEKHLLMSIRWLIKHWNAPQATSANVCCQWHATLHLLSLAARQMMKKTDCKESWTPYRSWQCRKCTAMNSQDAEVCDMCFQDKPSMPAERGGENAAERGEQAEREGEMEPEEEMEREENQPTRPPLLSL